MTRKYHIVRVAFTSGAFRCSDCTPMLSCIYNELQGSIASAGFRRWSKHMGWLCSSLSGTSGLRNFLVPNGQRTPTVSVCYTMRQIHCAIRYCRRRTAKTFSSILCQKAYKVLPSVFAAQIRSLLACVPSIHCLSFIL